MDCVELVIDCCVGLIGLGFFIRNMYMLLLFDYLLLCLFDVYGEV